MLLPLHSSLHRSLITYRGPHAESKIDTPEESQIEDMDKDDEVTNLVSADVGCCIKFLRNDSSPTRRL
jgi:hypothetical protein